MSEEMKKYVQLIKINRHFHFYDVSAEAIDMELISPTVVFIEDVNKLLTLDCGYNKICEIKLIDGELIIRPKNSLFILDSTESGILDINKIG